jgi:hypothetical protein
MTEQVLITTRAERLTIQSDGIDTELVRQVPQQTTLLDAGSQGPQGVQGVPGPAGPGDSNFEFTQATPSAVWTINHNLNKFPSIAIVDSAGDECEGAVNYASRNQLVVTFSAAFSGKAYLN